MKIRVFILAHCLLFSGCSEKDLTIKDQSSNANSKSESINSLKELRYKQVLGCYLENPIHFDMSILGPKNFVTISAPTFYNDIKSPYFRDSAHFSIELFKVGPVIQYPSATVFGLDSSFRKLGQSVGFPKNDLDNSEHSWNIREENGVVTYFTSRTRKDTPSNLPFDTHDSKVEVSIEHDYLVGLKIQIPQQIELDQNMIGLSSEMETICLKNGLIATLNKN